MMDEHVFVARERQLAQLDSFLDSALAGQGQVCFVIGDAGSGKTTMFTEFARRAQERQADLVMAIGLCDPQTGSGNPYLPFRELLGTLTGTLQARQAEGTTSRENRTRLKGLLHISGGLLVDFGPNLVGTFVPGAALAAKIGSSAAKKAKLVEKLNRPAAAPSKINTPDHTEVDRYQIFEQYVNVLNSLAQRAPLLLILDDLQWADTSSIDLLFHLTRRINKSRILTLGTYRPADVALGRAGDSHPLEKVLAELKRYHGDILIDLEQARKDKGQLFIDAFLDTRPNCYEVGFRRAFYQHTGAHPLFVVELLRVMQERGDVVQDKQGRWVQASTLDWARLPARTEGVIEGRIGRLAEEQREILKLASVQGETFIAEVLAQLQDVKARDFVRQLSNELEKRHRLINAQGSLRVGNRRLSRYQFHNRLFRQYLYASLNPTERTYLHEDVGRSLEQHYGEQADEIAVQLAWHFEQAQIVDKARHYLRRAGAQAAAQAANVEALDYYSRALALTPATDQAERYDLLLDREKIYDLQGARETQAQDLVELEKLATALSNPGQQAEVALRQAHYAEATGDYPTAIVAAQAAIELTQAAQDVAREAAGQLSWGVALWRQGDYAAACKHLEQALALAQKAERPDIEAGSLRNLGNISFRQGDHAKSRTHFEQALHLYHEINDRHGESATLNNLGIVCKNQGDYGGALAYYKQALSLCREIGNRRGESLALTNLGGVYQAQGNYSRARIYYEQALHLYRMIDDRENEIITFLNLGLVDIRLGNYQTSQAYSQQALRLAQQIESSLWEGYALTNLGHALAGLEQWTETAATYQQAIDLRHELGQHHLAMESLAGLARVSLAQGDLPQAQEQVDVILKHLASGTLDGTEEPFWIYLTCYQTLQANTDPRAQDVLTTTYNLLQERAASISDVQARRVFLKSVMVHREIVEAFAREFPHAVVPEPPEPAPPPPRPSAPMEEAAAPAPSKPARETPSPEPTTPVVELSPPVAQASASESKPTLGESARAFVQATTQALRTHAHILGLLLISTVIVGLGYLFWQGQITLTFGSRATDHIETSLPDETPDVVAPVIVDLSAEALPAVNLVGADLVGSTLVGVDLSASNLMAVNLSQARLNNAMLLQTNLNGADLVGADLRGALLLGANLNSADLRGAKLAGANLLGASLRGADLRGADLRAARLLATGDPLDQTSYNSPAVRAMTAQTWNALASSDADLSGAVYDNETRWPEGFSPPPGAIQQE